MRYTQSFYDNIARLKEALKSSDAVLIGAGAGLSASSGMEYSGKRFMKYFSDFYEKYGITDMYSGGFYPFDTSEEYWAWWSRHIYYNRYSVTAGKPYKDLLTLVKDKNYFVLTTNVDHQFQLAGFDKQRLFYTQGDYGLFQCSEPCREITYDNEPVVRQMVERQRDMKIPADLIPYCPVCGKPMVVNLRCDDTFVQDAGWYEASRRYENFLRNYGKGRIVLLELGVGSNTPAIIKYPFWHMALKNRKAVYACINYGEASAPQSIIKQSVCINEDIGRVLEFLCSK